METLREIFANPTLEKERARILLVDDDDIVLEAHRRVLSSTYETFVATSGADAIAIINRESAICCVVMDIKMSQMDGITAAREIRRLRPDTPVIFHTGYPGEYAESVIDKQERPFDYVTKGESLERLLRSVRNAVESFRLRAGNAQLSSYAESQYGIIGKSSAIQEVCKLIRKAAATDTRVMILGETGTGKELVARAIHVDSNRRRKKLAILNCNHKSPDLVESELFGHVRGAFTGAIVDRIGLFQYADGGTVFLDEIGDLDITTQAKLLRVLETGEYQRIGEPNIRATDTRVVCATHRDLNQMVRDGKFREDLFYRLKGVVIPIPPLRERREDIPVLIEKFNDRFTIERGLPTKVFDQSAIGAMIQYDWPGNVRQLLNTVESAIVLSTSDLIMSEDILKLIGPSSEKDSPSSRILSDRLRDLERTLIIAALAETQYHVASAAEILGIDTSHLHKKIKAYNINLVVLRE